jgi:hypothetical protein
MLYADAVRDALLVVSRSLEALTVVSRLVSRP